MQTITIVPARGGSKRLPGKNTRSFCGKPLLAYSIEASLRTPEIAATFVSTDDEQIAETALKHGASVIMRPAAIAGDLAKTSEVLIHALEETRKLGYDPGFMVTLQPTNPLRPATLLQGTIHLLSRSEGWDSIFSVSLNKRKLGHVDNGHFNPINYHAEQRSQDLKPTYYENGLVYISRVSSMDKYGDMFGKQRLAMETEVAYSQVDIDDLLDFETGEFLYQRLKQQYNLI